MKKRVSILIAGVLIALVCISLAACGEKGGNETYFVKTDGAKILGNDGTPIGLYGTNLGGWLVQEEWLVPTNVDGDYGQIDMMLTLANRFGMDGMNELLDVYMDNWVTELDFKRIANMGLNCVRIPFTYLNFTDAVSYDEESESYVRTPFDRLVVVQDSFARLDWALDMCDKYSLYAILDMHGAVGSQSGNDHTGDIAFKDGGQLWLENEIGETCRQKTLELWVAIANRYKERKCVAMYDLLNEPGLKVDGNQSTAHDICLNFFDELYKAIRAVDGNHAICMESCWTPMEIPAPSKYGWENVIYQYHHYNWASSGITNSAYYSLQLQRARAYRRIQRLGGFSSRQSQSNGTHVGANGRRSVGRRHRTVLRRRLEFHDLEFQARRTSLVLGAFQLLSRRRKYGRASGLLQYEQGRNRENMGKTQLAKLR